MRCAHDDIVFYYGIPVRGDHASEIKKKEKVTSKQAATAAAVSERQMTPVHLGYI